MELKAIQEELSKTELLSKNIEGKVPWIVADRWDMDQETKKELVKIGEEIYVFLQECQKTINSSSEIKEKFFASLPNRPDVERYLNSVSKTGFPLIVRGDLVQDQEGKIWVGEIETQDAGFGILQRYQEIFGQNPTVADAISNIAGNYKSKLVISMPQWKLYVPEHKYFVEQTNGKIASENEKIRFFPIEEWDKLKDFKGTIFKNCCTPDLFKGDYPAFVPPYATIIPDVFFDWKGWSGLCRSLPSLQNLALTGRIPESYILPLENGEGTEKRKELLDLSNSQRHQWIVKPIHSWGSRGFHEGSDFNREKWQKLVSGVNNGFEDRGFLLQKKIESRRFSATGIKPDGEIIKEDNLRGLFRPYYLLWEGKATYLGGLLALRNSIKVHGATDAFIALLN